jgi:hypothetical protein
MNHRELVLSASKKAKFGFLALPEDLQDEIVDGLDAQSLTLEAARDLVRSRSHSLSHEAIAGYYRAVRRERRLHDASQELTRIVADFAAQPYEESLKSLTNLVIAMATAGLADGTVGIKDIDLGRLLKAAPGREPGPKVQAVPASGAQGAAGQSPVQSAPAKGGGLSVETAEEIRRKILGVKP